MIFLVPPSHFVPNGAMEGGVDSFLYIFHPYGVKDKKVEQIILNLLNILGHILKFMNLMHVLANVTGTYEV